MGSPHGKDSADPPSRSTVSLPSRLTENARRYDQEGSSVESSGVSNSSGNVSSSSRTPNPPPDSVRFEDLKGKILQYAKDENYSRFFEQIIDEEEDSGHRIEMIFKEVINSVDELMMDHFGVSVFQKLLVKCNGPQIAQIINVISRNRNSLAKVCTDSIGNRAVQTLLQSLQSQQLVSVVGRSLSTIAVQLCKSKSGHRVIHRCLNHFSAENNKSLMNGVAQNCYEIAQDQYGCLVLQNCLSYCMEEQRHCLADIRRHFIDVLLYYALRLAEHSYGNYMVQYLLDLKDPQTTATLLGHFKGSYATLSRDKHGSHVVQKVLTLYGEHSDRIICELIGKLRMLVIDPFGSYVIRTALMVSKNDIRRVLMNKVQEYYPMMIENSHGRRVLQKLQEM